MEFLEWQGYLTDMLHISTHQAEFWLKKVALRDSQETALQEMKEWVLVVSFLIRRQAAVLPYKMGIKKDDFQLEIFA